MYYSITFAQDPISKEKWWGIKNYDVDTGGCQAYPYQNKEAAQNRASRLNIKSRYKSTNDMRLNDLKKLDELEDRV